MAVHAGTVDVDLGHRARSRQARDISHRFRRRPAGIGVRLFLAVGVAILLAVALRPVIGSRRDLARVAHPEPAPVTTSQVIAASSISSTLADAAPSDSPGIAADSPGTLTDAPPTLDEPGPVASDPAASGLVFRVQLGSFLDVRNALRMVERLRGEGLPANVRTAEGQQMRYRVLVTPGTSESEKELLARLSALGIAATAVNGQIAVTGFVPTDDADAIASRLEDEAIAVRVEREQRALSYHAVRVGAYRAAQDAERARAELAARGLEGVVVRESDDSREAGSPDAGPRPAHL
jgi:cell division protein FtsN